MRKSIFIIGKPGGFIFTIAPLLVCALLFTSSQISAQTKWTKWDSPVHPKSIYGQVMVFDSDRNKIVLFGGMDDNHNFFNETWEWDVNKRQWKQRHPANNPQGRAFHAMAYDSHRKRIVLQGGMQGWTGTDADYSPSTWEWDGSNWIYLTGGGPGMRSRHSMVYDSARQEIVLFGGCKGSSVEFDDTWIWDGITWQQKNPATNPDTKVEHAMAYDSIRQRVVMQGGSDKWDDGYWEDDQTWEWNGVNWTSVSSGGPERRAGHAMAFDSSRGVSVCFGGTRNKGDINDNTWK